MKFICLLALLAVIYPVNHLKCQAAKTGKATYFTIGELQEMIRQLDQFKPVDDIITSNGFIKKTTIKDGYIVALDEKAGDMLEVATGTVDGDEYFGPELTFKFKTNQVYEKYKAAFAAHPDYKEEEKSFKYTPGSAKYRHYINQSLKLKVYFTDFSPAGYHMSIKSL